MKTEPRKAGLARIIAATGYSWQGLRDAWRDEAAFRQEVGLAILLTPVALWLPLTPVERALLLGSLVSVLAVELLNSAIEAAVDRISPEPHELSRKAKDLGSAAVMLTLLGASVTWAVILLPVFASV